MADRLAAPEGKLALVGSASVVAELPALLEGEVAPVLGRPWEEYLHSRQGYHLVPTQVQHLSEANYFREQSRNYH
ncbi:MAG TPA: hypothetical protein VKF81_13185 [Blastocatellia bacterium]|nr:hypothetical protein [Blastocatellia bacterium]